MSGSLCRCFRNPRAQGGSPKTAKNGQKWPKMTTRGRKLIKPSKLWYTPHYPLLKSFNLGKHLHKEPDVYIYTLAMAPAKKTPLILNSFHFYSFFWVWLLVVDFSHCCAHFGPLLGANFFLEYDHI